MDNIIGAQDIEIRAETPLSQNSHPGPPRILVVDDDRYVGEMLNRSLTRAGYQVRQATSYEDAAQLLSASVFHTAVVDICLGDHDGLELLADMHTLPSTRPQWTCSAMKGRK